MNSEGIKFGKCQVLEIDHKNERKIHKNDISKSFIETKYKSFSKNLFSQFFSKSRGFLNRFFGETGFSKKLVKKNSFSENRFFGKPGFPKNRFFEKTCFLKNRFFEKLVV